MSGFENAASYTRMPACAHAEHAVWSRVAPADPLCPGFGVMTPRLRACLTVLAIGVVLIADEMLSGQGASAGARSWTPPRTADSQLDVQGLWNNVDAFFTLLQRPEKLGEKPAAPTRFSARGGEHAAWCSGGLGQKSGVSRGSRDAGVSVHQRV